MEIPMPFLPKLAFNALAMTLFLAPADAARAGSSADDSPVMELVTFRLVPGVADTAFLAAARGTEAPLRKRPGFLSRSLTRGSDGLWTDHVLWSSLPEAMAAAEAMMAEPAFAPFMAAIDGATVTMRHDRVLWQMD
jgi:hypothetical protein